jgi:hypothetical protein
MIEWGSFLTGVGTTIVLQVVLVVGCLLVEIRHSAPEPAEWRRDLGDDDVLPGNGE